MTQPIRTVSIKGVTARYLTIILLVTLAGVLTVAIVGSYSSREAVTRHERLELDVLSRDIGDLVGFYRQIAMAFAKRQEVGDILRFSDVERAIVWAKEVRSIVPESIGVALVETDGRVLGEPLQLKLGKQCVSDLSHILHGEPLGQPPVHRAVAALQHFDIVVPVKDGSEAIGLLFMSFSLDVLKKRIDERIGDSQFLAIREKSGELIARTGMDSLKGTTTAEALNVNIPGTDWVMYYRSRESEVDRLVIMAIAIGGMVFLITIILTLFFSGRIVGFFSRDLHLIRALLDHVHSGAGQLPTIGKTYLRETAAIMENVAELVQQIEQSNRHLKRQSMHDALTGLYNRRAFDEALAHYAELAARNTQSRLVLLDLDLFKQVNDHYGHGVGDEVLVALADALRERCRSSDILARLGGDEFALILTGQSGDEVRSWFNDLEKLFVEKQAVINSGEGISPYCQISAGSVVINAKTASDIKKLMETADRQLYEAKRAGRATIRY